MAEWSNAAVLKTVEAQVSGGSNPSPSALFIIFEPQMIFGAFFLNITHLLTFVAVVLLIIPK